MGFRSLVPYVWPIYGPWMSASLGMSILLVSLPIVLVFDGHGYALAALVGVPEVPVRRPLLCQWGGQLIVGDRLGSERPRWGPWS